MENLNNFFCLRRQSIFSSKATLEPLLRKGCWEIESKDGQSVCVSRVALLDFDLFVSLDTFLTSRNGMDSKLKPMALQVAGWGLLHGDFFDLYDVAELLQIPAIMAKSLVIYLRKTGYVETVAETRSCKREVGKASTHRVFIKVLAIHPEPLTRPQSFRLNVLRSKLARLSKIMPLPQGSTNTGE